MGQVFCLPSHASHDGAGVVARPTTLTTEEPPVSTPREERGWALAVLAGPQEWVPAPEAGATDSLGAPTTCPQIRLAELRLHADHATVPQRGVAPCTYLPGPDQLISAGFVHADVRSLSFLACSMASSIAAA